MQKYILVKLLEDVPIGSEFSAATWPLHLTLVDDFLANLGEAEMRQKLREFVPNNVSPVRTVATGDALLGPQKTVPVTLLEVTPSLLSLHTALVDFLEHSGSVLVSPEFARGGYKPHVTVQGDDKVATGVEVVVDAISVIAMSPNGKTRLKLLDTVKVSKA